jgi:hypothetical protein
LYGHIEAKLSNELSQLWVTAAVQFLFTVPVDWLPDTIKRFRSIVFKAGFGGPPSHALEVGTTEAEAAVIHAYDCVPRWRKEALGKVLLVCDAGQFRTYVCLFRALDATRGFTQFEKLQVHTDAKLGFCNIDSSFEALVYQRLQLADKIGCLGIDIASVAWEMVKSREFLNQKLVCGSADSLPLFVVPIPGLHQGYNNEKCDIRRGEMLFWTTDLEKFFDAQVEQLSELLRSQLQEMQKLSRSRVVQILLNGVFYNVPYVFNRIRSAFLDHGIQIGICPEPQLAVARGVIKKQLRV